MSVEQCHNRQMARQGETIKRRHVLTILMNLAAAAITGAIFIVALFHQFPLVEVAASLLTGLQVFFLSSAIGDMLEEKEPSHARNSAAVLFTVFLIAFYSFTRYVH